MSIDLHIHSKASDGTHTVAEIIEVAVERGLSAISICDHDSFAANAAAGRLAAGRVTYIPGVEVSTHIGDLELHILGYFTREDHGPLVEELEKVREDRAARVERTVARLNALGVSITVEDVHQSAGAEPGHDIALGRPHIAAALVKRGAVESLNDAFDQYLRRGRPAYLERYRLKPERAIGLIREAGGLPVLAHPGLARNDGLIAPLVLQGLAGLEAYHTAHTEADVKRYLKMAERLGLYVTGGTDSHGPGGSHPVEIGDIDVPDEHAVKLLKWRESH